MPIRRISCCRVGGNNTQCSAELLATQEIRLMKTDSLFYRLFQTLPQLEALGEALLEFCGSAGLGQWPATHRETKAEG
jgi:hypothetical protein